MNALDCIFGQDDGFQFNFGGVTRIGGSVSGSQPHESAGKESKYSKQGSGTADSISGFGGGMASAENMQPSSAAADSISGVEGFACEDCRGDGEVNGVTCRRCGGKGVR